MLTPEEDNSKIEVLIPEITEEIEVIKKEGNIVNIPEEPIKLSFSKYKGNLNKLKILLDEFPNACIKKLLRYFIVIGSECFSIEDFQRKNISYKKIVLNGGSRDYNYLFSNIEEDEVIYEFDKLGESERAFFFIAGSLMYILDIRHHPNTH